MLRSLKDILIIAHFTQAPGEKGNGRFHYIAENMKNINVKIEVVTSSFSHKTKMQRNITNEQLNNFPYKFTMLFEPSYQKNVTLKRIYSHYVFGENLKKYLQKRKKPDVIYCAVPSLDVAKIAAKYAKSENIKFILDVQDLWPEAFKMVIKIPVFTDIIFYPMKKKADYIYSLADEIIAVSESYLKRALEVNDKSFNSKCVYLGTELNHFDQLVKENKNINKPKNEIWLGYIGTLGHSYDLRTVFDGLKLLQDKGYKNIKFIIMGDGPLKKLFKKYAHKLGINTQFTGELDYGKMIEILSVCNIVVNPIKSGSAASIINKHADYVAAGLPVINTQENPEYRGLVEEYQIGLNCLNNNPTDFADKLLKLYEDESLRKFMGENSRRLAEEKFDRKKTYIEIISLLIE